jgi:hypothetical protein
LPSVGFFQHGFVLVLLDAAQKEESLEAGSIPSHVSGACMPRLATMCWQNPTVFCIVVSL